VLFWLGAFLGCFLKKHPVLGAFSAGRREKHPKKAPGEKSTRCKKKAPKALVSYYLGVWGAKAAERPRCLW
jgi:hypothetical protein